MPSNVIDTFYFLFLKSYFADFVRWARTLLVGRELVYSSAMNLEHCFPNTRFKLKLVHIVAGLLQSVFDGDFESFIIYYLPPISTRMSEKYVYPSCPCKEFQIYQNTQTSYHVLSFDQWS